MKSEQSPSPGPLYHRLAHYPGGPRRNIRPYWIVYSCMKTRIGVLIALVTSFACVLFGLRLYQDALSGWDGPLRSQSLLDRKSEKAPAPIRVTEIVLERHGSPLGPAYTITFKKGATTRLPLGKAWYVGKRHVSKMGTYSGDVWDFDRLAAWIEMQHFSDFDDEYNKGVYEGEIVTTSITIGRVRKTVTNYAAGAGPIELWVINAAIDGVAANIRWEKIP